MAPPMMARYKPGMEYGAHADSAFIPLPGATIRSDISCTIFLSDPADYDGGELQVRIGDAYLRFKLQAGDAILYPSDTLHQVLPVTRGERLVAITFIQSRVQDPFQRNILYELRAVGGLEGSKMDPPNHARLQLVEQNLLRCWADNP
jgi:PKHD-type hydroxylase